MKEFQVRTIWGLIFASTLTGAILLGPFTFAMLFLILSVFVLKEFYTICEKGGFSPQVYPGIAAGIMLFILSFLIAEEYLPVRTFLYLIPLVYAFPVYELYRRKENPYTNIALTVFGIIYVTVPFSIFNFLAFSINEGNPLYSNVYMISLFIFVWASDSGAYLFGVSFGKHRLFERISPKKSWEGLIGGILASLLAAWVLSLIYKEHDFYLLGILAVVVTISGTMGDLIESMFKRSIGLKDSGRFMPGHGGLLDRFDSILLATPAIYFVLRFFT